MIAPTYITAADTHLLHRLMRKCLRGRILDVGCGKGEARRWLGEHTEYVGLDNRPGPGVSVVGDAQALPFGDETFDGVLCASALEHVVDERQAIAELYRVVKPGGTVLITLPFLLHYHQDPEDYRRLTKPGLTDLLRRAGFTTVRTYANYGAFTVIEFVLFSLFVHARREHLFARRWYLAPYYLLALLLFGLSKIFNYMTAPLQRYDTSLYVGFAAVARK